MAQEKFDSMDLLRNSIIYLNDISSELICVYCKKILINAHQTLCGCKFCRKCLDKLIITGNGYCPGNTEECKENIFSKDTDFSVDYRTNNIIFKLKVKCPNSNCHYECEFKNMNLHFNTCKSLIECQSRNGMKFDTSNMSDINVKNLFELFNQLKIEEDSNKTEINKLKELVEGNNFNRNSIIELIQSEIKKPEKQIDNVETNGKIGDIQLSVDNNHSSIICELNRELRKREIEIALVNQHADVIKKTYSDEFKQRMEVHIDEKLSNFICEMKTIFETELSRMRNELFGLNANPINFVEAKTESIELCVENGISSPNKFVDPYVWRISEFSTKLSKEIIRSLDFFSQDKSYLVRILLNRDLDCEIIGSGFHVDLMLIEEGCELGKGFPMNRDVKINILNQETNTPFISFIKTCSINKSEKRRIFSFVVADLPVGTVLKDDSIVMECII